MKMQTHLHKAAVSQFMVMAVLALKPVADGAEWSAKLAVVEACCCDLLCPCIVTSSPTRGHCQATCLVEIRRGHYKDVRLDGVSLIVTEEVDKWGRFYITDRATARQAEAAVALVNRTPELAVPKVVSVERVPISVSRSRERIRFATPVSVVEIEPLKGGTGKAVTVQHLSGFIPHGSITRYVLYRTIQHSYHGKGLDFDYPKMHGATYNLKPSGRE